MPSKPAPRPTAAELEILNALWTLGPSTVRDVAAELGRSGAYTTVLKLMQIMTEKKLVKRDEEARAHIYRAIVPKQQMQQRLVKDLAARAFGGSVLGLLQHVISGAAASKEDLRSLREMIEEQERRKS
jgi:predicted transcriptional regulator